MGYKKIPNHYRPEASWIADAVRRGECLHVSEKVHGTSASITYLCNTPVAALHTGQGGPEALRLAVDPVTWRCLSNEVVDLFQRGKVAGVRVYGEHYGGKIASSRVTTYGPHEHFIVFEVALLLSAGWMFLGPEAVATFCSSSALPMVPFNYVHTLGRPVEDVWSEILTLAEAPSRVAAKHGQVSEQEGVVVRSLVDPESIAKYVRPAFRERKSLDPLPLCAPPPSLAVELVTEARVQKAVDRLGVPLDKASTGAVIDETMTDLLAESDVTWDAKELRSARAEIAKTFRRLLDATRGQAQRMGASNE